MCRGKTSVTIIEASVFAVTLEELAQTCPTGAAERCSSWVFSSISHCSRKDKSTGLTSTVIEPVALYQLL